MNRIDQYIAKMPTGFQELVRADLLSLGHNLSEWTYQTDASVAIGGISGRGQHWYTGRLKQYAADGLLHSLRKGRTIRYRSTESLRQWAIQLPNPYPYDLAATR